MNPAGGAGVRGMVDSPDKSETASHLRLKSGVSNFSNPNYGAVYTASFKRSGAQNLPLTQYYLNKDPATTSIGGKTIDQNLSAFKS